MAGIFVGLEWSNSFLIVPHHHAHNLACYSTQTSCMTFINIVVNSCEDLNYRVYLQHEFTMLDIDDYLEELEARGKDYPALQEQIKAYQDNFFNVDILVSGACHC